MLNDREHSEDTRSETQSFERSEQSTPELRPVENPEKPLADYIQLPLHTRRVATIIMMLHSLILEDMPLATGKLGKHHTIM